MERRVFLVLLTLIVGLGAYLRLANLGGPSLWLDEILHLRIAQSLVDEPWYRHLTGVREMSGGTENGAVYYGLQILGQKLAPGETGARLFPAILGILMLPLMARVGWLLGGPLVALTATFLLAVSPLHVYFSREGRPYYLLMALALVLLWLLLREGTRRDVGIAYAVCLAAAYVGLHSVPLLASFATLSGLAFWQSRKDGTPLRRSPRLHYMVAATLALALAYGLYMTRSNINRPTLEKAEKHVILESSPGYKAPLSWKSLEKFLASMTTSGHVSVAMVRRSWALLVLPLVGLAVFAWRRPRELVATAGMFILPAALSVAALVAVRRWYEMRYTSPALPAFLLLTALGIAALAGLAGKSLGSGVPEKRRRAVTWAVAVVLMLVFVAPNLGAARTDAYRKLDWRGVARFFDSIALEDEPVVVPNLWPQICLEYYLQDLGRQVEFIHVWETAARGQAVVDARPKGWLLTAGFRRSNAVRDWTHRFVPVLKHREEEMELHFFPDFVTLLETRFAAGKGMVFERRFAELGQRFDFSGSELILQGNGWSYPEKNKRGNDFQWAMGEQAELGLPIGPPRDASIRFRVLPFPQPASSPRPLELWLNDRHLATLALPSKKWTEQEVEVPASAWRVGANVLFLRFPRTEEAAKNPRDLSVAFDYLEVVP